MIGNPNDLKWWIDASIPSHLTRAGLYRKKGISGLILELYDGIISKQAETAWMMVPCCLYFIQNNLLLWAVAKLDPPVYYVVSQVMYLKFAFFEKEN